MLKTLALVVGIILIIVGVLGFVPMLAPNNMLLGLFMVDPIHNLIHIVTGIIALFAATSVDYARLYFQIFGVIYAIITILGFALDGNLFIMHVNMADNILHLVIAVVFLIIGFGFKKTVVTT